MVNELVQFVGINVHEVLAEWKIPSSRNLYDLRIMRQTMFSFLPGCAHRPVEIEVNIVVGIFEGH